MLTISPPMLSAYREQSWPAFVERVRGNLFATYPHFLPCFPQAIQTRIVWNMLSRAQSWGLLRQDSLYAFCEMMIEIAPNFDEHPTVASAIEELGQLRDQRFAEFARRVPPNLSLAARSRSSTMPLFVAPALSAAPADQRLAEAIRLALWDRPEAADPRRAVAEAMTHAQRLDFDLEDDAPLVIAACLAFWGPDFERQPWAAQLHGERWNKRELLALLRLRIALDFGRFV